MPKASKKDDHAEMNAILKRMLETLPRPHDEKKKEREPKPAPKVKNEPPYSRLYRPTVGGLVLGVRRSLWSA
jgi:hypothetical protein